MGDVIYQAARQVLRRLPPGLMIRIRGREELLFNEAGFGDTMLVAAVAREIKRVYGKVRITVNRTRDEILSNSPYVDCVGQRYAGVDLWYHKGPGMPFREPLLMTMCRKVGIANPDLRPQIDLSTEETQWARQSTQRLARPIVTIHTTPGEFGGLRKHWVHEHWEACVASFRSLGCTVLQLGARGERPIRGARSLLGTQDIRRSIGLIAQADVHVGVVSSLMHASAAVGTPAVIVFGGFERHAMHGYPTVLPVESNVDCSPCITPGTIVEPCPQDNLCMRRIVPDLVVDYVRKVLQQ